MDTLLVKKILTTTLLVASAVEMEISDPGSGAQKKARATELLLQALDPLLPDWLNPVLAHLSGFLIDTVVAVANRTGFFGQLGESSSGS